MAARGSLRAPSRLPALFLTLQRNVEYWSSQPLLSVRRADQLPRLRARLPALSRPRAADPVARARSASSTATGAAASATTRAPARCSTRRCRWPPSARAGSRGSTCSRSTARRRRGSARSPRAPACRRWRARPRGCSARRTSSRSPCAGSGSSRPRRPPGVRVAGRRRRALPAVLRAREPADPQRLRPVARRALRLRRADRATPPRARCSTPATSPRAPRSRRSTPARGRCTRAGRSRASPTSATTSCCATSSSQLCSRTATIRVLQRRASTSPSYLTVPPVVEVLPRTLRPRKAGKLRFKLSKISRVTVTRHARDHGRSPTINPGVLVPRDQDAGLDGAEEDRGLRGVGHRHRPRRATPAPAAGEVKVTEAPVDSQTVRAAADDPLHGQGRCRQDVRRGRHGAPVAAAGLRTLVISTDPAHSLADVLQTAGRRRRRPTSAAACSPSRSRPRTSSSTTGARSRSGSAAC